MKWLICRRDFHVHADKAPAALISIVGRKEYESCAEDIYNFLQVSFGSGL